MTYEEREKTLCNNCEAKENCSYISRNLESKCSFKETTMYGWELGWQDAADKFCEFLKSYRQDTPDGVGYIAGIVNDETIEDFRKYMEEKQRKHESTDLDVLKYIRKETCCGLAEANNALLKLIKVLKEHPLYIMDKSHKLKIEWEEQQ